MKPVYIVSTKRTPMGALQGQLSTFSATQLGGIAIKGCLEAAGLKKLEWIDDVLMGCVLQAGLGQAPARQASLAAGIPINVPATTISKVCGSGLRSVMLGAMSIQTGLSHLVVCGGMESMTNAPYLLQKARAGYRMGHGEIKDHMFFDGLEDPYSNQTLMGVFAQKTADHYNFSRADQDKFALQTYEKAKNAQENAEFLGEIVPVIFKDEPLTRDETLLKIKPEKIPTLRPAFSKDGTITAASSSSIADGAAAILLASEEALKEHNLTPLFKITGMSQHSHGPEWFTTAPVGAMKKLFDQLSLSPDQVDAFEVNEAFAVVTMAAIHDLKLPTEKVNQRGGACALGHPIGASGARILTTLCHLMQDKSYKTGMATLCIGGGEAVAIAIESV